ncbi:hypothetical protein JM93_00647 [Roseibium hamelinense]|uniref:HTH cro/C1-type domain-containing protein n=1 Tax=Roseibium hamelinense TaxID=150831 RepID=A0A562THQ0_9HYPH|nr:helix-turn-helix transcriptional regulator [Roseibium hamelinense]MTI45725.1 XRE family transcriptional regulator [Roseibium hamelinense]TWI93092.1 hypothetical protein JM93_00647 [Roseibium hamelinense]
MPRPDQRHETAPVEMHDLLMSWGEDIAAERRFLGLSQSEFAACLYFSEATVARVEKGDPTISLGVFVNILWALGLVDQIEGPVSPAEDGRTVPFQKPTGGASPNDEREAFENISRQLQARALRVLQARDLAPRTALSWEKSRPVPADPWIKSLQDHANRRFADFTARLVSGFKQ